MKIHGQGHACGQRSRSYCWLSNRSIYFLFVSHQSTLPFLRYSYLKNWSWNPQPMWWPMSKLTAISRPSVQSIHYFFILWNRIILSSYLANSIFLTLKIQGHGQGKTHWSLLMPSVHSIYLLFVSWQSVYCTLREISKWPLAAILDFSCSRIIFTWFIISSLNNVYISVFSSLKHRLSHWQ